MPTGVHQRRWDDGRTLLRTPLGTEIERHFGFRQYQSHRADVLNMLIGAMPPDAYISAIGWYRSASAAIRSKRNSRMARA